MLPYISLLAWSIPTALLGNWLFSYISSTLKTRQFAATSPLPSINIYTPRDSMLTWLLSPWFGPFFELLPCNWGHWFRYVIRDAFWLMKGDQVEKDGFGYAFWSVGPGGAQLWVSDADLIAQIVQRRNDFVKKVEDYVALNLFGVNVVGAEGTTWQRHRKITGPPFNEKNSSLVFDQTLNQAKQMLNSFTHDANGQKSTPGKEPIVEDLAHWTMTITLNVISSASMNIKALWPTNSVAARDVTKSLGLPFQESFDCVMNNIRVLITFPAWILRNSPFPSMRKIQKSSDDMLAFMHELIATHKAKIELGAENDELSSGSADLLGNIVKGSTGNKTAVLSEEEMIGNIFIFVLAGHETTASTLQTALILLACEPKIQMEIQKEIDEIWAEKKEGEDLTYDDYGKMRAIMAVMLETLRLYPPVVNIPKITTAAQTIAYNKQLITIPPNSRVSIDVVTVQRNPNYWGPSQNSFLPSRWLMPPGYTIPAETTNESPAHQNLLCPQKGSFIAFSGGFRGCLGKKFAQVEFCTVVAVLLRGHSIELVGEEREEFEMVREKALEGLDDRMTGVAMWMKRKVKVRFVKRGMESFPKRD